ncbi:MAG: hypothetical protein DCC73_03320 [Proteobacteria bacterium]|nr:MAG: hypothetical protein DCC73_03320 [Pseudomonadota bacterium]
MDGSAHGILSIFGPGIYVSENDRIIEFLTQIFGHYGPYAFSGQSSPQGAPAIRLKAKGVGTPALAQNASRLVLLFAINLIQHVSLDI